LADEQVHWDAANGDTITDALLWALSDNLGTVRDLALAEYDSNGDPTGTATVVNHRTFDAFGQVLSELDQATNAAATLTTPFAFTGRELDSETGLYFYRARYYDPATGRFLSEDPIADDVQNSYRYVGNGPTNATDPSGLKQNASTKPLRAGSYSAANTANPGLRRETAAVIAVTDGVLNNPGYPQQVNEVFAGMLIDMPIAMIEGVGNMLASPVQTAKGVGHALAHPFQTAGAVWTSFSTPFVSGSLREQGKSVGEALSSFLPGPPILRLVDKAIPDSASFAIREAVEASSKKLADVVNPRLSSLFQAGRLLTKSEIQGRAKNYPRVYFEFEDVKNNQMTQPGFNLVDKNNQLVPTIYIPRDTKGNLHITDLAWAEEIFHYEQAKRIGFTNFHRIQAETKLIAALQKDGGPEVLKGLRAAATIDGKAQQVQRLDDAVQICKFEVEALRYIKDHNPTLKFNNRVSWPAIERNSNEYINEFTRTIKRLEEIRAHFK